jgi:hypothetical protein
MDELNRFEAMLVNEGALVLKFWIHLSKDAQRERLKAIEANPADQVAGDQGELGSPEDLRQAAGSRRSPVAHDEYALGTVDHRRGNRRPLPFADRRQDDSRRIAEAPGRQARSEYAGGPPSRRESTVSTC